MTRPAHQTLQFLQAVERQQFQAVAHAAAAVAEFVSSRPGGDYHLAEGAIQTLLDHLGGWGPFDYAEGHALALSARIALEDRSHASIATLFGALEIYAHTLEALARGLGQHSTHAVATSARSLREVIPPDSAYAGALTYLDDEHPEVIATVAQFLVDRCAMDVFHRDRSGSKTAMDIMHAARDVMVSLSDYSPVAMVASGSRAGADRFAASVRAAGDPPASMSPDDRLRVLVAAARERAQSALQGAFEPEEDR